MSKSPPEVRVKQPVDYRYVDRPDLMETFAESIHALSFDGRTLRIEFCVTRFDEPKPQAKPSARRIPVCRMVLTRSGTLDLIGRLRQVGQALTKAGAGQAPTAAAIAEKPGKSEKSKQ